MSISINQITAEVIPMFHALNVRLPLPVYAGNVVSVSLTTHQSVEFYFNLNMCCSFSFAQRSGLCVINPRVDK